MSGAVGDSSIGLDGLPSPDAAVGARRTMWTRARLVDYGSGHVSVRYYVVHESNREQWSRDAARDRERSTARAVRNCRDRIMVLGATAIVTLTYRQNLEDLNVSREHLRMFVAKVRRAKPGWKFVGVAERQKRGAIHWHLAVKGWQDISLLRSSWSEVIGRGGFDGNIDVRAVRSVASAAYIAKYLGKGLDEDERPRYGHHYMVSRGLQVEVVDVDNDRALCAGEASEWSAGLLVERGLRAYGKWHARPYPAEAGGWRSWEGSW